MAGKAGNYGAFAADVEGAPGVQLAILVIKWWPSPVLVQAKT
jgi:hypothetical protein